ncbi:hypothetical protein AD953_12905 [Acetobacter malorum]|uniref:Uncharacterized protein n=1 Tax=Acetobacter malorum TaxID=178901 RepID=A0A149V1Z8_9PROT|nr:hypothetical protein AD953_12905 [Acetobacter malorum]
MARDYRPKHAHARLLSGGAPHARAHHANPARAPSERPVYLPHRLPPAWQHRRPPPPRSLSRPYSPEAALHPARPAARPVRRCQKAP